MSQPVKLFIPGPVEVSAKTLAAMATPMIGHRGNDFKTLYQEIMPGLKTLFGTAQPVLLSTSSAWGVMEGAIRNLVNKGVLNCMCGAFSDKWYDVSQRCGKRAEPLSVPWGQPIVPAEVDQKLATGRFDAITLIHNETSTGVVNPLEEIGAVVRKYPEVAFIVDTVSSFSAMPIDMDRLGIDLMLTGSQKALALPPGLSVFACSEKAYRRAGELSERGYYFDLLEFKKNAEQFMTPSTPTIPHIYALRSKLEDIFAEGPEARFQRHRETNRLVHQWVAAHGFEFFAPAGFRSVTLTCVRNNRGIDVAALVKRLREQHGFQIDGGYGKIKGSTFRISNMGDETAATMAPLLAALDEVVSAMG
ncbi:MAG: alanine--glyoxylate aminotransferase family protein [Verrucomicrobia bacterium]|nr:alanine--glyoxylate aminotransferase family protein [Verrucomicrobiota bacterium]